MNDAVITNRISSLENVQPRVPPARRFIGVAIEPQSYRNVTYLLLGFPAGVVWFSVLVTAAAIGLSMLIVALVGIPLLLGLWYVSRALANVERRLANTLLGRCLATVSMNAPSGGLAKRLRAMTADRDRWRELIYLLSRLPIGAATFLVVIACFTTSAALAYAPFYARYHQDASFGDWSMSDRLHEIASNVPWSWLLVPVGVLMLIGSLHFINALARASARWTVAWLDFDTAQSGQ